MPESTRAHQPHASISVAELCSKQVAIDWSEAIAISQALCQSLCGSRGHAEGIRVDTQNVFIDADGSVKVRPGAKVNGVTVLQQVTEVLRALLPEENAPSAFRSVLFHPPAGSTLEIWSKSIEYYERQNRVVQIQAVYERAVHASVRMTAVGVSGVVLPALSEHRQTRRTAAPTPVSGRRAAATGIAALAVATAVAGGAWMIQARVVRPARDANAARGSSLSAGRSTDQGWAAPSAAANPAGTHVDAELEAAAHLPSALDAPSMAPDAVPGAQPASIVYSEADEDVVPPSLIDPRFPSVVPKGKSLDEFAEFEVLVTESGVVESVRALRVPATMSEAVSTTMRLSGAKTWRFHPALKDGVPVKYLDIIWVLKS